MTFFIQLETMTHSFKMIALGLEHESAEKYGGIVENKQTVVAKITSWCQELLPGLLICSGLLIFLLQSGEGH